jgi:hypothetical protein
MRLTPFVLFPCLSFWPRLGVAFLAGQRARCGTFCWVKLSSGSNEPAKAGTTYSENRTSNNAVPLSFLFSDALCGGKRDFGLLEEQYNMDWSEVEFVCTRCFLR